MLIARIQYLPDSLYMIFYYAFEPQAIIGGGFGEALRMAVSQGVKRGLFSNEAGIGTTPHAHVHAAVDNLFNGYRGEVTAIVNSENLSQVAFGSALDLGSFEGFGAQFFLVIFSTILVTYIYSK